MIHGKQELKLTSDSVREAINDWLQKHMAPGTELKVVSWKKSDNDYTGTSLTIEFEQVQNG